MKEERVNRKDGALEETDKDLREQMRWGGGGEIESQEKKAMEEERGGQSEKERDTKEGRRGGEL